jgi:hypothetical protein
MHDQRRLTTAFQMTIAIAVQAVKAPVMAVARRGLPRGLLIWLGPLGYLAYVSRGAPLPMGSIICSRVYVALFALTPAALIAGLSVIDPAVQPAALYCIARRMPPSSWYFRAEPVPRRIPLCREQQGTTKCRDQNSRAAGGSTMRQILSS